MDIRILIYKDLYYATKLKGERMFEGIIFIVGLLIVYVIGGKAEGDGFAKSYGEYSKEKRKP